MKISHPDSNHSLFFSEDNLAVKLFNTWVEQEAFSDKEVSETTREKLKEVGANCFSSNKRRIHLTKIDFEDSKLRRYIRNNYVSCLQVHKSYFDSNGESKISYLSKCWLPVDTSSKANNLFKNVALFQAVIRAPKEYISISDLETLIDVWEIKKDSIVDNEKLKKLFLKYRHITLEEFYENKEKCFIKAKKQSEASLIQEVIKEKNLFTTVKLPSINPEDYGLQLLDHVHRKFPLVENAHKQKAIDFQREQLENVFQKSSDSPTGYSLTPEAIEWLRSFGKYMKFFPSPTDSILGAIPMPLSSIYAEGDVIALPTQMSHDASLCAAGDVIALPTQMSHDASLCAVGDVIALPTQMSHDASFNRKSSRNLFMTYLSPAPASKNYGDLSLPESRETFLTHIKETVKHLLQCDSERFEKTILSYFGMENSINNAFTSEKEMNQLRKDIAISIIKGFDAFMDEASEDTREKCALIIAGPNGQGFSQKLQKELEVNFKSFFGKSKYQSHIFYCPNAEIFELAQKLADQEKGELLMTPIRVISECSQELLGDNFFLKSEENSYREENSIRCSTHLAIAASLINGTPLFTPQAKHRNDYLFSMAPQKELMSCGLLEPETQRKEGQAAINIKNIRDFLSKIDGFALAQESHDKSI